MRFKNYQIRVLRSILNLDLNLNEIVFNCFTLFVIHCVSFRIGIIGGVQAGTMRNSRKRAKSSYCSQLRNTDQTLLRQRMRAFRSFIFRCRFAEKARRPVEMEAQKKRIAKVFSVDEDWQTTRSAIRERMEYVFDNKLLSDVKFIVPRWRDCNLFTTEISAHKFVLGISSPVFYAMFYGKMAEKTDSIKLPDCDRASLTELFRYMYFDEVSLSSENVMRVLYLARKYMVPSLEEKCNAYLQEELNANTVLDILQDAQKFGDEDVEERCLKVLKAQTKEALSSYTLEKLDSSLLESIVKMDGLNVREVELFKAVDRWAARQGRIKRIARKKPPDGGEKREIIGQTILKAIRFPLMSLKEFASTVIDSNILTMKEISEMAKYYADVSISPLSFEQAPRIGPFKRCCRFGRLVSGEEGRGWYYRGSSNEIRFSVNKDVILHGVQHFGSEDGKYEVSVKIKDLRKNDSFLSQSYLTEQSGSYLSSKENNETFHGFDVLFDKAVALESGTTYEIVSNIRGPDSWYGLEGKPTVECCGVTFTFSRACSFVSDVSRGQFPALIFTVYV